MRHVIATLLVLVYLVGPVHAHDPGLSAAEIVLTGDGLSARLTFARAEIESIIAPVSEEALERLARSSLTLTGGESTLTPRSVGVEVDASDAVHFTLDFAPTPASSITVRSTLIERLPRGHRPYVTVRTRTGEQLTETILDASRSSIEIETGAP